MLTTLLHIPRRVLIAALVLLVVGGLLFLALTRTQVGRDELRDEIVRQFDNRFEGRLEIGSLRGNLIYDLYASDVRLTDSTGATVLTVDSMVVEPSWSDLVRRTISSSHVTLYRPRVHLVRDEAGRWNLDEALRSRRIAPPGARWSFESADVRVIEGSLTTHRRGEAPELVREGWLFDYTDAEVRDLSAHALVELRPDFALVDVFRLTADLPGFDASIDALHGQLVVEDGHLSLSEVELHAGDTYLAVSGSAEPLGASFGAVGVDLELAESRLGSTLFRRLFPRYPLADDVTVAARLQGPLSQLVIERVAAERGQTRLAAEGTLVGLPDSIDFDLAFAENTVALSDVRALLPEVPLPPLYHLGSVGVTATLRGSLPLQAGSPGRRRVEGHLDLLDETGRVTGDVALHRPLDGAWAYEADLRTRALDVGRIARRPAWASALNGRIRVRGEELDVRRARGELQVALAPSHLAHRTVDTLHVALEADEGIIGARGWARDRRTGYAAFTSTVDARTELQSYRVNALVSALDLGPLLADDSLQTRLNATVVADGAGFSLAEMRGELSVEFDSSEVSSLAVTRTVLPHRTTVSLVQVGGGTPHLEIGGDLARARLEGDVALKPLASLVRLWGAGVAAAVRRETAKPYANGPAAGAPPESGDDLAATLAEAALEDFLRQEDRRGAARAALAEHGLDRQVIDADLHLLRSDILAAFFPGLPPLGTDLHTRLRLETGADSLRLEMHVEGDSLQAGAVEATDFQADLRATGRLDQPLEKTIETTTELRAAELRFAGQQVHAPRVRASYGRDGGLLALTTDSGGAGGPLRLNARLDLLPDRNRLTVTDLYVGASGHGWDNVDDSPIDLYADAVVVPGLVLENRSARRDVVQRVRVEGRISPRPEDTLYVGVRDILLRPFSEMGGHRWPVGGRANGRIALTGVYGQPEITGQVDVATLSFDDRILGHLSVSSRYLPGRPDVALDLRLAPSAADTSLTHIPGTGVPAVREVNDVAVAGTFRLPGLGAETTPGGLLDLRVEAHRADAFFFEYLFRDIVADVRGVFSGEGALRGSFDHPLFEGRLSLTDGSFRVPPFDLAYQADGDVRLDDGGIRIERLHVRDRTGGSADIDGSILFNDYEFFSFDLRGALDELQIMNVLHSRDLAFYGRIWASGAVTLTGPLSNATLRSSDAVTSPSSSVFIPITEDASVTDAGFIVFADSTGQLPDIERLSRRTSVLAQRPAGERQFLDGLDMDLNLFAPEGSTVHLVIDPLLGDMINAVGSGRIQLQRQGGEFSTYGALDVSSGDYLFTAGEVFYRRFLIDEGRISWDGDPLNASLDIAASYRTRASTAGLEQFSGRTGGQPMLPLIVHLHVLGRVASPVVDLRLSVDQADRDLIGRYEGLEAELNQPDRSTEYATSVLLTNSFLLTTEQGRFLDLSNTGNQLAFNSLSQLVASQLNRYINQALPNLDLNFGFQGESTENLDVTYGVALRLLDERLVIRGQGIYATDEARRMQQGLLDEFIVEVRLNPSMSIEVFYRREDNLLSSEPLSNTSTTGAGLSYETRFSTWERLFHRLFGWLLRDERAEPPAEPKPAAHLIAPDAPLPPGPLAVWRSDFYPNMWYHRWA